MKKLFSVIGILVLFSLCSAAVFGLGKGIDTGVDVDVTDSAGGGCTVPIIHIDHTARGWDPSDQTRNTARIYDTLAGLGPSDPGGKYDCGANYDRYFVPERQNYVFTGEKLDYYVALEDPDTEANNVQLLLANGTVAEACAQVEIDDLDATADPTGACGVVFDEDAFGIAWDDLDGTTAIPGVGGAGRTFICKLIVDDTMVGPMSVSVQAVDACSGNITSDESDYIFFNPTLDLFLEGSLDFGPVAAGSTAISDTVYIKSIKNVNDTSWSGVVMDMYISSDGDFYSSDPTAICPPGNSISSDQFSYYATKGSVDSGLNNAQFRGLGLGDGTGGAPVPGSVCEANADGFTPLVAESGSNPANMCRIINHKREGSLLTQGSEMSLTFKVDVPPSCSGSFDQGKFYFVGEVV